MTKSLIVLGAICIVFASCQKPQPEAPAVNQEEASKALGEFFDRFNESFKRKDANGVGNFLSDDGLFLGTDPGEFWSKQRVVEEISNMAKDTTVNANYNIDKREIRMSADGTTAIVIEQMVVPFLGKIPARTIAHAAMKDGQWKIDFFSWNMAPKNESLKKLSEVY